MFVIDTLQFGGAEQSLLENSKRFKTIDPIVCHLYQGDVLKTKFIENNIQVYSLNISKKYGFVKAYRELKKIVELHEPDLLVAYLTRSEIVTRMIGRTKHISVVGTFVNDLYTKSYNRHLPWTSKKSSNFLNGSIS